MEMNPQRVRSAEFKTVRKGADPDEVRTFLNDVADELERAQNQSTAMEARARAAVARLQELSDAQEGAPTDQADRSIDVPVDQSETISRTLLLAQRTADSLVSEARAEATRVVAIANDEAARTRDSTREMAASMLDEARVEARLAGEMERLAVSSEVDALKARRDFLESDVDHLEQFLVVQRSRLRDVAGEIVELTERVPSGLGEVRRPLLSASDDGPETTGAFAAPAAPHTGADNDLVTVDDAGDAGFDTGFNTGFDTGFEAGEGVDLEATEALEIDVAPDREPESADVFETTDVTETADSTPSGRENSDDFRFSFDDDNR